MTATDSVHAIPLLPARTVALAHRGFLLLILVTCLIAAQALAIDEQPPLKVVLVGDSTVCDYPAGSPVHGWGEVIKSRFRPRVRLVNYSRQDASTQAFLDKGTWLSVLRCRPSIVLIQFGLNEPADASMDQFKDNLGTFISVARHFGSTPILVTPPCSRVFASDGRFKPPKNKYVEAIRKLGKKKDVPVIDLHASSATLYSRLGAADSGTLAGDESDVTRLNSQGAAAMAELVLQALSAVEPRLRREIIQRFAADDSIAAQ